MREFALPDLGEGLEDAEIIAWHVGVGDHVVAEQPLVSVETAKALVEIPSPWSGRIARLVANEGDIVKTGAPLVSYEDEGTQQPDEGTVVGKLPSSSPQQLETKAPGSPVAEGETAAKSGVRASPFVRQLARSLSVDLAAVSGTGPDGVITRGDVERAVAPLKQGYEPLRGVRRAMALNMARSAREVPGSTVTDEADIGGWPADVDVTTRLIEAMVAGCAAAPALNAWFDGEELQRKLWAKIDIGLAIASPEGLFVPVLREVQSLAAGELRKKVESLKQNIEMRKTHPADMTGATISLSNFGMMGGVHASLAIVPPQVAILGAGRILEAARPRSGELTIARVLPLSLSFDHRVVTGAEAVTFLNAVIDSLQESSSSKITPPRSQG